MQPCLREWLWWIIYLHFCLQFFRKKKPARISADGELRGPGCQCLRLLGPAPIPRLRSDVCWAVATLRSLKTPWAMSSRKHSGRSKSPSSCDRWVRSQWAWADMCRTTPQQHRAPQQDLQEGERANQFTPFFLFRVFKKHISQLLSINVHVNCGCKNQNNKACLICNQNGPPRPPQNNAFDS